MRINRRLGRKGFTLIELLITIFLVSIGLIGMVVFFNSTLTSNFEAKNELIAAALANEANELARNIVDYNYLNGNNWYDKLCSSNTQNCANRCKSIDYGSLTSHDCITDNQLLDVCVDGASSRYYQCSSSSLDFDRKIGVSINDTNGDSAYNLNGGDCLKVIATVTWSGRTTEAADIVCKPRQ